MLPFVEVPILLFLIALQLSASGGLAVLGRRPLCAYCVDARCCSIASLSRRNYRASSQSHFCRGCDFSGSGTVLLPRASHAASKDVALGAAVLIVVCGVTATFVKHQPAKLLRLLEIFAWLAVVVVTSLLTLLLIVFARSGFNH
jgi:hypothetical protein